MKHWKQKLLTLIMLVCCVLMTNSNTPCNAASKSAKFSCHTLETILFVGKTYDIYCYGNNDEDYKAKNVTYTSSDSKVATVTNDGKVIGKSYGDVEITVTSKSNKNSYASCKLHFYNDILTIKGSADTFQPGCEYTMKANKKDVIWSLYNIYAPADTSFAITNTSIDSNTGKVKIRNAGKIYIFARTTDGKSIGSTYIDCVGPMITAEASFDKINVDKDMGIVDLPSLIESGLLPKTIKQKYTDGKSSGTIECQLKWRSPERCAQYEKGKTYYINADVIPPEGYTLLQTPGDSKVLPLELTIKTKQTDNRTKIVKFEEAKIVLKTDKHITNPLAFICNYYDTEGHTIVGVTESGKKVDFTMSGLSGYNDVTLNKKGTYTTVSIQPKEKAGYVFDSDAAARLTIDVKEPQTDYADPTAHMTLNDIQGLYSGDLTTTQDGIK